MMRKTAKKSISRLFTRLFILSFTIFSVLIIIACAWFSYSQKASAENYLKSNLSLSAKNLENYFSTLERVGYGISSNWSIINLYAEQNYLGKTASLENSFQMISLLVSMNSSITDVMIVDMNGTVKSYFAGLDYNIIHDIPAYGLFSDKYNFDRTFYFFPEDSPWSENYFVYCVPILNMDVTGKTATKVATGVILCNRNQINQLLKSSAPEPTEFYALYQGERCIFPGSPEFLKRFQKSDSICGTAPISRNELSVRGVYLPRHPFENSIPAVLFFTLIVVTSASVLLLHAYNVRQCITKPINKTKNQLLNITSDLSGRIDLTGIEELDVIVDDINHMIDEIHTSTKQILLTQDSLYETELRKKEAELYALQSQINPHFLNNTLQCICGLAALNRNQDIRNVTLAMSDVFKYSITPGKFVNCADEINIIYKYLSIYKIRYDGKLGYEINVDEEILDCKMQKMIIQPTVENAILHAYVNTNIKPMIHILGSIEEENITFRVIDNGTGIPRDKLLQLQNNLQLNFSESIQNASPFGLGLYNINRRIKLVYGEKYGIEIFSNVNGTEIDITIPICK